MYVTLISQQFKKTLRAKYFSQGWGIKILVGFMVFYFGGAFLVLGIFMPEILKETYPSAPSLTGVFNSFILYYFLVDLAMRFFLQDLNLLSVQHYLLQNIRKSKVINFLLGTSIFSFFNLLPLFFIVPFAFRGVKPETGLGPALLWLFSMLLVVLSSHFMVIFIKRAAAVKQAVFFVFAGLVALMLGANSFGYISLRDISATVFGPLGQAWFLAVPLALVVVSYAANFRFLQKQSYIDQWKKQGKEASTQSFGYLESKGALGTMIANELKLILRNKRTKSILVMTAIFCAYGLLFYGGDDVLDGVYAGFGWKIFAGIFMTGIFMINYGQFLIGWEGAYFDGILTRAYPMQTFFRAKFWLLVFSAVITYILTLGYVYFTIDALWINTACFIYNVGLNSFVLLYASTYQKKKIDLSKGSAFNYQGTSATQFIIVLPLMILPILIFQAFNIFDKPYYGLAALAAAGLISLACSKAWFAEIAKNFQEKKYKNAAGFREN